MAKRTLTVTALAAAALLAAPAGGGNEGGRPSTRSAADLVVDPFGDPRDFARLWRQRRAAGVVAGGGRDVGEIAVIEDDGTMVVGGETDSAAILDAFYQTHGDEYDEVSIHVASTYAGDVDPEAGFAFFSLTAGFAGGINRFQGNPLEGDGLTRLTGFTNMNDLPEYPDDPTADFFGGVASYVEIMGQEFEHAWGAFVQPASATGADILGRGDAHWSFFLDHAGTGNASPMEGNHWTDNGGGSFTTIESFTGLAELDEYLMGLRAPSEMSPFFVIDFPGGKPFDDSAFPQPGVTVNDGVPIDLTIQDIIDNHGPRGPDTTTSMKSFRHAFVLVIPPGSEPDPDDLAKLDAFRLAWADYFEETTEGRGTIDTTLSLGPAADPAVFVGPDTFESGTFDSDRYAWNQGATISDLGAGEPSGTLALRLNGDWGGGDELRTVPIDLTAAKPGSVTLDYAVQRTGDGNSPEAGEDLLVEYFNNAGDWVVLRTFAGGGPDQQTFTAFSDPIPDDGIHGLFRFRFHRLQGSLGPVDDFFVDDVGLSFEPGCPWDCGDGDGTVGTVDFLELLAQWAGDGACDVDGNGVGVTDFLSLLAHWGPCP